jgi:hypothetical protein
MLVQDMSGKAMLVQVSSTYVCLSQVMSVYFSLGRVNSCVWFSQITPGYVRLGLVNTG